MTFKEMALNMYPYWILGAGVLIATYLAGYRDVIRIEKSAILKWIKFLAIVTVYRTIIFKCFPHVDAIQQSAKNISIIPWAATLTVFWEDACHGLPLFLLRKLIGTNKWTWPIHALLMGLVMLEFGLGHVYQGIIPAIMLSFYIPYSIKLGEKFGFGTVMVCHTLFDLVTILSIKLLAGV